MQCLSRLATILIHRSTIGGLPEPVAVMLAAAVTALVLQLLHLLMYQRLQSITATAWHFPRRLVVVKRA
jgi:hypothetical protein